MGLGACVHNRPPALVPKLTELNTPSKSNSVAFTDESSSKKLDRKARRRSTPFSGKSVRHDCTSFYWDITSVVVKVCESSASILGLTVITTQFSDRIMFMLYMSAATKSNTFLPCLRHKDFLSFFVFCIRVSTTSNCICLSKTGTEAVFHVCQLGVPCMRMRPPLLRSSRCSAQTASVTNTRSVCFKTRTSARCSGHPEERHCGGHANETSS